MVMMPITARARHGLHLPLLAATLGCWLGGCAGTAVTTEPGKPDPEASVAVAPEWRPGDRWVYGWTSGAEQGTKTVEVVEVRDIANAPFYVLRVGELEHFYTTQLQWAGHARDRKIESRISPPLPWFTWPLEPGRRWTYRGTLQDSTASVQRDDTFLALGAEVIEVPAGRFNTIKVLHESDKGDRNEYWYAPDVRSYVKWVWHRGTSSSEELLREHHAAPRT